MLLNQRHKCQRWIYGDFQGPNDASIAVTEPPYEARPASQDAFDLEVQEDRGAHVKWESTETLRGVDAGAVELEAGLHLCNACLSALGYLARHLAECLHKGSEKEAGKEAGKESQQAGGKRPPSFWRKMQRKGGCSSPPVPARPNMSVVHHWNLMALHRSAMRGCHLCVTVWDRCFKDLDWAFQDNKTTLFWNTTDGKDWDGANPGDVRLICAMPMEAPGKPPGYPNILRFQLWPSLEYDQYFGSAGLPGLDQLSLKESKRPNGKSGNTRSCRQSAIQWLSDCKSNISGQHDNCDTNFDQWQPTRLLDVESLKDGKVLLVGSESRTEAAEDLSEYISLSHCWGEWGAHELPVTSTSNLEERLKTGLDWNELPQTFRDAAEIAHWFNGWSNSTFGSSANSKQSNGSG